MWRIESLRMVGSPLNHDGYPGPESGQRTAISSAIAVRFVPAYAKHDDSARAEADAAGGARAKR